MKNINPDCINKIYMKRLLYFLPVLIVASLKAQINTLPKGNVQPSALKQNNNYFRVVVKGFTCNRETADDILERDGKRDEIYLTSFSYMANRMNKPIASTAVRTRTRNFGDINGRGPESKWAMAGSAAGALGGIQTGDQIPDMEPWKNNAPASGDLLPFVLWEGNLIPNSDYVVIHPGITEYDGPADFFTNFWHNSILGDAINIAGDLALTPFTALTGANENFAHYNDNAPGVWPVPTVMQQFGTIFYRANISGLSEQQLRQLRVDAGRPNDRPIGIDGSMLFNPLQIRIDHSTANVLVERDFGFGKGIVPIKYRDDDNFKGEYTLYISFEKPDASQQNRMNITHIDAFDPLASYSFRSVHAPDRETDVLNGGMVSNTHVVLNELKGLVSQRWKIKKVNQYYYAISNNYNNLNLDLLNKNDINGSNIVTSAPDNSETQQWSFIRYCDGSWLVRNFKTRRMMEVYNAATHIAAPLGQWDGNFARNQRWFIEK